jgi:chemotaxis protein methyltransferase CheR
MSVAAAIATTDYNETLSASNFRRLSEFIQGHTGIKMPSAKKTMLEGRLRRRMRVKEIASVNDYCHFLFEEGGLDSEMIHLIDAVTTNKTEFFREPVHYDYVTSHALPELVRQGRRKIKAWSAAASIGAEAYSLAMVLEEFCEGERGWTYDILGTDLSTQVLEQAVSGVYTRDMIAPVPMDMRRKYVLQSRDPTRQDVRMSPQLRARTAFARLNLMDDHYPVPNDMDLVFCRNILIYFDKPTQGAVLRRLCDHLRPGGYLFLGHSESIVGVDLPVTIVANTIFRRD